MHELLTLQCGNYANWVGSHFWNFQDEVIGLSEAEGVPGILAQSINHDVLYRTGETRHGQATYTPRLVTFDLKGSMGAVGTKGLLYDSPEDPSLAAAATVATWGGGTKLYQQEVIPKNSFLSELEEEPEGDYEDGPAADNPYGPFGDKPAGARGGEGGGGVGGAAVKAAGGVDRLLEAARALEDTAEYYTDFLKCHVHPRSVFQVEGAWQGVVSYTGFGDSKDVMGSSEVKEEVTDRIRVFVEECDSLQGFQLLAEDVGGFGQLAKDLAAEFQDEYSGTPVSIFSLRPPGGGGGTAAETALSSALGLGAIAPLAGVYVPIDSGGAIGGGKEGVRCHPHLVGNDSPFRAAALHAALLDTCTLPHRLAAGALGGVTATASGAVDMRTHVRMLRARLSSPLVAAHAGVPAAAVRRAAPGGDARMGGGGSTSDSRMQQSGRQQGGGDDAPGCSATAPWTQGLDPLGEPLVESLVLRGARYAPPPGTPLPSMAGMGGGGEGGGLDGDGEGQGQGGSSMGMRQVPPGHGEAGLNEAAEALDQSLLRETRAVRQRCVVRQPLPVPLPFPRAFAPTVLRYGDVAPHGWAREPDVDVTSLPFVTRLSSTLGFRSVVDGASASLKSHGSTPEGRRLLDAWGYGGEELGEVREALSELGAAYRDQMSGSDLEDDDDDSAEDY